jgi:riboflavin kinase/FMN adenylyltransferase
MDVIHFPDDARPAHWVQPVLALGNFDGVHRGHRKILERVRRGAGEHGATSVVMMFDPHPSRVVRPDKAPPLLMTTAQKLEALASSGLQGAAIVKFTPSLSHWDPEMFVRTVLVDWLRVAEVWVGANFLFGHDRAGNFTMLRTLGMRYGFKAEKIDAVRYKDFVVSSTRIRRLVSEGRVDEAAALLGHEYYLDGIVVKGDRRGTQIGFPPLICVPTTSCCRRMACMRRRRGWARSSIRRLRTSASVPPWTKPAGSRWNRTSSTSTAICTARRSRSASCSACATSAHSSRSTF